MRKQKIIKTYFNNYEPLGFGFLSNGDFPIYNSSRYSVDIHVPQALRSSRAHHRDGKLPN